MKKNITVLIICSFIMLHGISTSASTFDDVKTGNKLYKNKQYDKAIDEYVKANDEESYSDILNFNTGAALYQQGKYEEAIDAFTNSLMTDDKGLEAKANYNIANSQFKLGSQDTKADLSKSIQLYKQSLDHYKRAIELDEANDDARYNHELVETRMKVLMDRQKNQQEQEQQKEKDGEEEKGEEQEGNVQQKFDDTEKEQGEDKQEIKSDQAEADKQKKENSQESAAEEDKGSRDESTDAEEGDKKEMTQEEANMLLETFGEEESLDSLEKRGRAQFRGVIKNW